MFMHGASVKPSLKRGEGWGDGVSDSTSRAAVKTKGALPKESRAIQKLIEKNENAASTRVG